MVVKVYGSNGSSRQDSGTVPKSVVNLTQFADLYRPAETNKTRDLYFGLLEFCRINEPTLGILPDPAYRELCAHTEERVASIRDGSAATREDFLSAVTQDLYDLYQRSEPDFGKLFRAYTRVIGNVLQPRSANEQIGVDGMSYAFTSLGNTLLPDRIAHRFYRDIKSGTIIALKTKDPVPEMFPQDTIGVLQDRDDTTRHVILRVANAAYSCIDQRLAIGFEDRPDVVPAFQYASFSGRT
ncbi:MAG: hypothetical protein HY832_02320 [Candidatus Aenigmarchaeota archaeon]|nr:hypothetical protein [Candidatus Aenigmarchaeota archaeon]